MPTRQCRRRVRSPHARNPHRPDLLAMILALGGALALILYTHGARWWYAPLALPGAVLAHMAVLGGIVFVVRRVAPGRHASGNATPGEGDAGRSHEGESILLHHPRQFDLMARVCMFGQERKLRQWTLDLADLQPGSVVLDVGCGTGTLLLAAGERVGPSGALHGLDAAPEMAAHARHKAEARGVSLEVLEGSANKLPYPPASFDAVFCTLVLHHLPGSMRAAAIREMRRVLRPGGRAVIVDWQRPKPFVGAITSPMFLVYLLHRHRSGASPLDTLDIEPLMREIGFEEISRSSFGAGGVSAVIGRLGSEARAMDGAEPQGVTQARPEA